ncbi:SMI1/KNR4 family protein [Bacillus thuringiensis]|uniref:SMI1/KNR4 family protein n=1 Tax=Bacillus thuringiensis TaxID=1428 RepID=A0A9X6V580_BACTU|nr:SMI1/KNR4 family protein [Bacillus thuringiensis]AMR88478.1 1,3-beta-glucan synthase regulator [Bacillus thuringiensis]KIP28929.1 SMI1 / KNR4 family protein [Bacillus thuringiensis serovar morrisoni]MBG9638408.1 SMI1/KNR4 family protein [Bacillus thuringiensis]MBG9673358.1 SMI1/KNR4 family protein [Bacillus thuringiensis]MCT6948776.1 SMI1/KNR4 family protein [Bacillus thuringiensis]
MNHITWINANENKITNNQIKQLEQYFNIKFPNDFIECVQKYDGGYPTPDTFYIPNQDENSLNNLLTLDSNKKYPILETYNNMKDRLPGKIYPFARDPFGNLLCFDYRNTSDSPSIVFWDHEEEDIEEAIYPVCSTFTELLDSLYEFDDEE